MATETRVRHDPDGVRSRPRPGGEGVAWLLWPVLVFVLLALGVSVYFALAPVSVDDVADEVATGEPEVGEQPPAVLPPVGSATPEAGEPPAVEPDDTAEASGAREQPTGIALFPPRGTKPIKRGIIVPDDFPLPPGYMRHYQTTDEGQQLPAILLFHPDYVPRDASGAPIPVPPDRVVPPELAPPGLPIQMLDPATVAPPDEAASTDR